MPGDDEIESVTVSVCLLSDVLNEVVALQQLRQMYGMLVVVHINAHVEVATDNDQTSARRQPVENCRQLFEKCYCQWLTARSVDAK